MTEPQRLTVDLYQAATEAMTRAGQEKFIFSDGLSFQHGGVWGVLSVDEEHPEELLVLVDEAPKDQDDDKTVRALANMTALELPAPENAGFDRDENRIIFGIPRLVETGPGLTQQQKQNLNLALELTGAVVRVLSQGSSQNNTRERASDGQAERLETAMDLINQALKASP